MDKMFIQREKLLSWNIQRLHPLTLGKSWSYMVPTVWSSSLSSDSNLSSCILYFMVSDHKCSPQYWDASCFPGLTIALCQREEESERKQLNSEQLSMLCYLPAPVTAERDGTWQLPHLTSHHVTPGFFKDNNKHRWSNQRTPKWRKQQGSRTEASPT